MALLPVLTACLASVTWAPAAAVRDTHTLDPGVGTPGGQLKADEPSAVQPVAPAGLVELGGNLSIFKQHRLCHTPCGAAFWNRPKGKTTWHTGLDEEGADEADFSESPSSEGKDQVDFAMRTPTFWAFSEQLLRGDCLRCKVVLFLSACPATGNFDDTAQVDVCRDWFEKETERPWKLCCQELFCKGDSDDSPY